MIAISLSNEEPDFLTFLTESGIYKTSKMLSNEYIFLVGDFSILF